MGLIHVVDVSGFSICMMLMADAISAIGVVS
jgi:hypothetical protein